MPERFANAVDVIAHAKHFACQSTIPEWPRRWNIRPGELVPTIIQDARSRRLGTMRWGWRREQLRGRLLTNTSAEKAPSNDMVRTAYRSHRCIVPCTAWFEWAGEGGKQFHHRWVIRRACNQTMAIAALWENAPTNGGGEEGTVVFLSVGSVPLLKKICERMPVILPREHIDAWLSPETTTHMLRRLAIAYLFSDLEAYPGAITDVDGPPMIDSLPDPGKGPSGMMPFHWA
jgi:putative SOS response-associated peptidase YedK